MDPELTEQPCTASFHSNQSEMILPCMRLIPPMESLKQTPVWLPAPAHGENILHSKLTYHHGYVWIQVCLLYNLSSICQTCFCNWRSTSNIFRLLFGFAFNIPYIFWCWKYSKLNIKGLVFSCISPFFAFINLIFKNAD